MMRELIVIAEFINPYGIRSSSQKNSESSSDRLSQFGTARDHHFDVQNEQYWYNEKDDDDFMTPNFEGLDFFSSPTDKFIMTSSEMDNQQENPQNLPLTRANNQVLDAREVGDSLPEVLVTSRSCRLLTRSENVYQQQASRQKYGKATYRIILSMQSQEGNSNSQECVD